MAAKEWYGVIDVEGVVIERYETPEEADRAAEELNGILLPGEDAEFDYRSFTD